jgi:hypothetical protein
MTLPFDARRVREALALFENGVTAEEGARLAALVGSWEELLAHLLLRRGSLPADVAAAIRAACDTQGRHATPRPPGPDVGRLRATEEALHEALAALIAADAAVGGAADAALAAFGAHAAERPGTGSDLHLRIGPRGR